LPKFDERTKAEREKIGKSSRVQILWPAVGNRKNTITTNKYFCQTHTAAHINKIKGRQAEGIKISSISG